MLGLFNYIQREAERTVSDVFQVIVLTDASKWQLLRYYSTTFRSLTKTNLLQCLRIISMKILLLYYRTAFLFPWNFLFVASLLPRYCNSQQKCMMQSLDIGNNQTFGIFLEIFSGSRNDHRRTFSQYSVHIDDRTSLLHIFIFFSFT